MTKQTFAIVGASLAGAHAAHQLRKDGFDGRILLIGDEQFLPYDRPPLSKAVLLGEAEVEKTQLWSEADYAQAEITPVLSTRVTAIDRASRSLEIEGGENIAFDKLLLCTGARARDLPFASPSISGVNCLRSLDDALRIRDSLKAGSRVVVIGFGFIGAEVAAAARKLGCTVTLVEAASLPMQRILGSEAAIRYCNMHKQHGVDIRLSTFVEEIREERQVKVVRLSDGSEIDCDSIIYGVGSIANSELAKTAGAAVGNGIIVNRYCETSVEGIYACGDVASRPSSYADGHIRLESWQNAYRQAVAAARSMLGIREDFDDLPWFWSDQYDLRMQLAGLPGSHDKVIWRGDGDDGLSGSAFYFSNDHLKAVLGLNRPRDVRAGMDIIKSGQAVDPELIRNPDINIGQILKGEPALGGS